MTDEDAFWDVVAFVALLLLFGIHLISLARAKRERILEAAQRDVADAAHNLNVQGLRGRKEAA